MKAAVASGHPRVSQIACDILEAGGNAFDAIVAAGFASCIAEPGLTSLGGGGFLLAKPSGESARVYDFFVDTPGKGLDTEQLTPHFEPVTVHFPGSDQVFNVGLGSAAVPGNLKGFLHVHRLHGRMPLADALAPARELALQGLELHENQAYVLSLLEPILTLTEGCRKLYAPEGQYLGEGDTLRNHDFALFLDELPGEGADAFYQGEFAHQCCADMRTGGGLLTADDLIGYRVVEREPLETEYRGLRLLTNPSPSLGGSLIALSLEKLGALPAPKHFGSVAHIEQLARVMMEVDWMRENMPDEVAALQPRKAVRGTTHVSVCDREGNVASMTTSNGEGSGYVVPGTGIMLNNMMGEDDLHPNGFHSSPPGERVASMMSPSIVMRGDQVKMALGSGGSKRIRTAILQVICNTVDFGMNLQQAIDAPRAHWDGEHLQLEPGFKESSMIADEFNANRWQEQNMYFGGVQAVSPGGDAGGDSRRGGSARLIES